jgi:hypothetical protein
MDKKFGYNGAMYQLFIYFEKTCNSIRKEVLYKTTEFSTHMKLVKLIKMCLKKNTEALLEGYREVC